MKRKFHVRFLGGGDGVSHPCYPADGGSMRKDDLNLAHLTKNYQVDLEDLTLTGCLLVLVTIPVVFGAGLLIASFLPQEGTGPSWNTRALALIGARSRRAWCCVLLDGRQAAWSLRLSSATAAWRAENPRALIRHLPDCAGSDGERIVSCVIRVEGRGSCSHGGTGDWRRTIHRGWHPPGLQGRKKRSG